MFILSDQIIILFLADTFSEKHLIFRPHYKRNKYKLLEKTIMQRVLHQPAPDTVNLVLKKKKKKKLLRYDSWVPSLRQDESVSMNTGLGGGVGGRHSDFSMVRMRLPF